jgi:hypothetical protein
MLEFKRGDRQNREAALLDDEWIFVWCRCELPRYFTIRSRRVDISSMNSVIKKENAIETYSSKPYLLSVPSPFSAVMNRGDPLLLHQRKRPRQFRWRMSACIAGTPAKRTSTCGQNERALAPIELDGVLEHE